MSVPYAVRMAFTPLSVSGTEQGPPLSATLHWRTNKSNIRPGASGRHPPGRSQVLHAGAQLSPLFPDPVKDEHTGGKQFVKFHVRVSVSPPSKHPVQCGGRTPAEEYALKHRCRYPCGFYHHNSKVQRRSHILKLLETERAMEIQVKTKERNYER